ncbi:MAG: hypothetical protein ACJATI_002473 [Halioglobus sp.]|jgi:hypothetical protein
MTFLLVGLSLNSIAQEVCDNGVDDDLDGFIDMYDEDCNCSSENFQAQCEPECAVIDTSYMIQPRLKWMSEVLNDGDFPGPRNIVVDDKNQLFIRCRNELVDSYINRLVLINTQNGLVNNVVNIDTS